MHRGWARRPKIAELLALPPAAGVLAELRLARRLQTPPTVLRGRAPRTRYRYDDAEHPGRVTSAVQDSWWTPDDRCLLLGLEEFEKTLCPGVCGQPKHTAWHHGSSLKWTGVEIVCHACSAIRGEEVVFTDLRTKLTAQELADLPPLVLGQNTTEPKPQKR